VTEAHEDTLTIHELAARTGVPPRRIRYYVAKGLLPPPHGRGPTARYGAVHVQRLRLIQELRQRRFGLEEIRDRLRTTMPEAVDRTSLWYQWELAPGVQLWARADLSEPERERVAVLVDLGQRLFQRGERD
jgi:DNA-binding transcriptional MerR regulator